MSNMILATASSVFSYIGYILLALVVLLVMITVHEFGHYVAGKIFKFKINEFAIGFGPKLFKRTKKNGEIFSIRLLPLGGFCSFEGEGGSGESEHPDAFDRKKPWQRIIVLVSGALMNLILAWLVITLMLGIYGQQMVQVTKVAEPQTEYVGYTLEKGDILERIDGKKIMLATDIVSAMSGKKQDDIIDVGVRNSGKRYVRKVRLVMTPTDDLTDIYKSLGIYMLYDTDGVLTGIGARTTNVRYGFFETLGNSFVYHFKVAGTIFNVLGQLITGRIGLNSLGGPITTVTQTAEMVKIGGLQSLLQITAFIGVNLGVFNLLPLPALDGSHVVFTLIEWIRKKPINKKVEMVIHACGFVLLLGFAVVVDLLQIFR